MEEQVFSIISNLLDAISTENINLPARIESAVNSLSSEESWVVDRSDYWWYSIHTVGDGEVVVEFGTYPAQGNFKISLESRGEYRRVKLSMLGRAIEREFD